MKSKSLFSVFIFVVIFAIGVTVAYFFYGGFNILQAEITAAIAFLLAMVISSAIKKQAPRKGPALTAWQIPLAQRAGAFSYHPDIRHHTLLDRHSRDYHFFQSRKNTDQGYGAG
jgi:hypothetical protein